MDHFTTLGLNLLFELNYLRSVEGKSLFGGAANNS